MGNFIGYTVGLECRINGMLKLVKVEYSKVDSGVMLHAVSGKNLGCFGGHCKTISAEQFSERPKAQCNNTTEAIWALGQLGLTPAACRDD